jgi:hypothetical protein
MYYKAIYLRYIYLGLKKLLLALNDTLYQKVKGFSKENGMPIVSAIRFILNQFFKNKQ